MKNFNRSCVLWTLVALGVLVEVVPASSFGQGTPLTGPSAAAALVSEFEVNGLKVLVKRRPGSQTVAAGLFIRGGSLNISSENAGIENLMLDVATEASVNFPRERMRRELARTGSTVSSSSGYDYSVLALRSTRPNFERSWQIFTDIALRPSFSAEDFGLVKNRHVTGLRSEMDDPDTWLQQLQERSVYAAHPYANRPAGTVESVAKLSLQEIRAYHRRIMETSRLLLVVVGDLDPAQVRARVVAAFGKLPKGTFRSENIPAIAFATPALVVTQRALPTNYIQGIFAAPTLYDPDSYPMRVAINLLRDRVFQEVRVKRNLSYAPDAFLTIRGASTAGIYVSAVDANQSVGLMLAEIRKLQTQPVELEEISAIAAQYLTLYYTGQETNAAQAQNLAEYELIGGGWRNSFATIDRVKSVTPADVQRVAQKYMRNTRFVVLGDSAKISRRVFTGQ